jgi:hypothetical protein
MRALLTLAAAVAVVSALGCGSSSSDEPCLTADQVDAKSRQIAAGFEKTNADGQFKRAAITAVRKRECLPNGADAIERKCWARSDREGCEAREALRAVRRKAATQ